MNELEKTQHNFNKLQLKLNHLMFDEILELQIECNRADKMSELIRLREEVERLKRIALDIYKRIDNIEDKQKEVD